jgi:hypothetical protein
LYFTEAPTPAWNRNFPLRERIGDHICTVATSTGTLPVVGNYLWVTIDKNTMLTVRVERRTFFLAEEADMTTEGIRPDLIVQYAAVPLPESSQDMPQVK